MTSTALRNVGIILLIAIGVWLIPGGGTAADVIMGLIGVAFAVGIWLFLHHMYREHRMTIFGLGDRFRGIFYASLAALLFAGAAAAEWFDSGPLTLLWFLLLASAVYGLVATWRHWREYS
jgi:hypothetical protein